ncbi:unnamed protein product, partial [Rangifer tarandus platyrhynchus]
NKRSVLSNAAPSETGYQKASARVKNTVDEPRAPLHSHLKEPQGLVSTCWGEASGRPVQVGGPAGAGRSCPWLFGDRRRRRHPPAVRGLLRGRLRERTCGQALAARFPECRERPAVALGGLAAAASSSRPASAAERDRLARSDRAGRGLRQAPGFLGLGTRDTPPPSAWTPPPRCWLQAPPAVSRGPWTGRRGRLEAAGVFTEPCEQRDL